MLFPVLTGYGFIPTPFNEGSDFILLFPMRAEIFRDGRVRIEGTDVDLGRPRYISPADREGVFHYYGSGKEVSSSPVYRRVVLRDVAEGVDAVLIALREGLEIQYVVRPYGNPEDITLTARRGTFEVIDGDVVLRTEGDGYVRLMGVKAYQGAGEVEIKPVAEGSTLRFSVGRYDPSRPLVIDPVVVAVITGDSGEGARDMILKGNGNVLVCGSTGSPNFAPSRTVFGSRGGNADAFITELSPDLTTHVATALVAGQGDDYCTALALDPSGDVILAGYTSDPYTFSVSRTVFGSTGSYDVFVTRLSGDLSTHVATAIVGGSDTDWAYDVAVGPSGDVYVAGYTNNSGDFSPSRVVFGNAGREDVFVFRISSDLTSHLGTAILASNDLDDGFALEISPSGKVFVGGHTLNSSGFTPSRIYMGTPNGVDAFVGSLSSGLDTLYGTVILAGDTDEIVREILYDGGDLIVVGWTSSSDFMPNRTVYGTRGWADAFVSRISSDLNTHHGTVIVAGSRFDEAQDATLGPDGKLYVTGHTFTYGTSDFSDTRAVSGTEGSYDIFLLRMEADLSVLHATLLLAGTWEDYGYAVEVSSACQVYVAGQTANDQTFTDGTRFYHGDTGRSDAIVVKTECPLGEDDELEIGEGAYEGAGNVYVSDGILMIRVKRASYVGYDVYDPAGRLVMSRSLGVLLPGTYRYPLPRRTGAYLVEVRVGERTARLRFVQKR